MKKLKIAGYQGDGSVHTRSVKFFIDKVSDYFDISFDQDITEKGQKAASLIEMTMNNEIQMSYLCLLYTSPSPRDRTRSRMPSSA